ncbi:MAG TPA: DUF3822 family protein [Chitinophagaceae bacterium]|nr:DUF3822 family protein [Chitinophagaceae bacterium]
MPAELQIRPDFAIDDNTLSSVDLTACTLLVLVGHGQFSYAVLDTSGNRFIGVKSYQIPSGQKWRTELDLIERCFDTDKMLYTAFRRIQVAFNVHKNVLVPGSIYSPLNKKDTLYLIHGEGPDEKVMTDQAVGLDMINIYAVNRNILGNLKKEFSGAVLCHAVTPLLTALMKQNDPEIPTLCLLPGNQWFHMLVFREGKLTYQQQIRFTAPSDILYHALNVLRVLELPSDSIRVSLGGETRQNPAISALLKQYFPHISQLERPAGYSYIDPFNVYPSGYFYHLFTLAPCAS